MYGLTKVAYLYKESRSFAARQRKQYKQLLDRLYGGKGKWESSLQENGERAWPGIYHGTSTPNADDIMQNGMSGTEKARYREFGKGSFFGDKETAERYIPDPTSFKTDGSEWGIMDRVEHKDKLFTNLKEITNYLSNHPSEEISGITFQPGSLLRLKTPNEMRGTQRLYPNTNKAMVFDLEDGKTIYDVAPDPIKYLKRRDVNEEAMDYVTKNRKRLLQLSDEDLAKRFNPIATKEEIQRLIDSYKQMSLNRRYDAEDILEREYFDVNIKPIVDSSSKNLLQTYGVIDAPNQKTLFDLVREKRAAKPNEVRNGKFIRREFFFKDTDIPKELLVRER